MLIKSNVTVILLKKIFARLSKGKDYLRKGLVFIRPYKTRAILAATAATSQKASRKRLLPFFECFVTSLTL